MVTARALVVAMALAACSDRSPEPVYPDISFPGVTVTEGGSTTFPLRLDVVPGSLSSKIGGVLWTEDPNVAVVMPEGFEVSPTNYPAMMTVYGVDDMAPAGNRRTGFNGFVGDNTTTSGGGVEVVDKDSLNVIASTWYIIMPPSATATFDVQLTQAPPTDMTLTLANTQTFAVGIAPSMMVFTPTDYGVAQTVMVTSATASGAASLELSCAICERNARIVVSVTQ
ncbi:MAG: hypothetical protein ACM31C_33525 [Acidobacteriota bacterium]